MAHLQTVFLCLVLMALKLSIQDGDTSFGIFRQKEYYFSTSFKLNWFKAAEFCRSRGMFLLSVRNAEEQRDVIGYLNSTGYTKTHNILLVWMSANDLGEEGEFYWASTGEHVNYLNWRTTEPNNQMDSDPTGENCVSMEYWTEGDPTYDYYYTFNDRSCKQELLFICETLPA